MRFPKTDGLWQEKSKYLAGGPATLSKHPNRFPSGYFPKLLQSGYQIFVKDPDGNHFYDTIGALGPIVLGHGQEEVDEAVIDTIKHYGNSLSLAHPLELEVAELLCDIIPCAEQVRFGKNGADATQAAVRLARHITGKRQVLCSGYHGGNGDWYIASTDKAGGILQDVKHYTHQFPWEDMDRIHDLTEAFYDDIACIIVEIPPRPWGEPAYRVKAFLDSLLEIAHSYDALFILDEVVTGFRYALGGAQEYYGFVPDLACFGKAMANGYSISAVCGPEQYMRHFNDGEVFFSLTFGGELIGLAAAKATIELLRSDSNNRMNRLISNGIALGEGLLEALNTPSLMDMGYVKLLGNHGRMILQWESPELKTLWMMENAKRSVLYGGPIFPMSCMRQHELSLILEVAKASAKEVNRAISTGIVRAMVEGKVIYDVFNTRYRETS